MRSPMLLLLLIMKYCVEMLVWSDPSFAMSSRSFAGDGCLLWLLFVLQRSEALSCVCDETENGDGSRVTFL
jgi:hypothetical protein